MIQYDISEAKNNLSKICELVAEQEEDYIVIASNGKPLVKIVPYKRRPGTLKDIFKYDDRFDDMDEEITSIFN